MARDRFAWRPEQKLEYRWRCGLRSGRWFKTYKAAGNDAVRRDLAWWEGERLLLGPLTEIESRPSA